MTASNMGEHNNHNDDDKSNMAEDFECTHFTFVHSTVCKFCGRLQCDRCRKKHESQHVANNDKPLSQDVLDGN